MSKCEIVIGDSPPNQTIDSYWFDKYITEQELIDVIKDLKEFYTDVRLPVEWPPQIRKEEIKKVLEKVELVAQFEANGCSVDGSGRVVIPAHLRKKLCIEDKDKMKCYSDGEYIVFVKVEKE